MTKLEIYPGVWDRDVEEEDTIVWLADIYAGMKDFLAEAAKKKLALIIYVT